MCSLIQFFYPHIDTDSTFAQMASRYLPPHLRRQTADSTTPHSTPEDGPVRRRLSELKVSEDRSSRSLHTLEEINHHYGSTLIHSTLHDSASDPGELGFVILFRNANPRWQSDRIIFAHTNIHILPGYSDFKHLLLNEETDRKDKDDSNTDEKTQSSLEVESISTTSPSPEETPLSNAPQQAISPQKEHARSNDQQTIEQNSKSKIIPIFMEIGKGRGPRNLTFHGYFHLANVDFLKPESPELVRMLQQKWEPVQRNPNAPPMRTRQRDPEAWAKSMKQEWAVIQFRSVPKDQTPEDPKIENLPDVEHKESTAQGEKVLVEVSNSTEK